jgi:hypothetical protein
MNIFRNALFPALALLISSCSKPPPLTTEAYVWQQTHTEAVDRAVERASPMLDGFYFHAADVSWPGPTAKIKTFEIPWAVAAATGKRAGIVIRIPAAEGGLGSSPRQAAAVAELIDSFLQAAKRAGARCDEVQIDYDCPESKLELYVSFLAALKAALPHASLAFTALPSWLKSPRFRDLAKTTGKYVLQVHSLELPGKADSAAVICDVSKARAAIAVADKIGIPFRVALPTYRCFVLLDRAGKRVDVISEGTFPATSPDVRIVSGESDPGALANLVAELQTHRSPNLTGVIWYRLPADTDRMNWAWLTFRAVAGGRQPASHLEVTLVARSEGYSTVEIRNTGEKSEPIPKSISVEWKGGSFEAADGLNAFHAKADPSNHSCQFLRAGESLFDLPPGRSLTAGWIRVRGGESFKLLWK